MPFGAFADQVIVLQPVESVVVDGGLTTVICEGDRHAVYKRYCRCDEMGFSNQFVLHLILDDQGNYDALGSYSAQDVCEKALHNNPACGG